MALKVYTEEYVFRSQSTTFFFHVFPAVWISIHSINFIWKSINKLKLKAYFFPFNAADVYMETTLSDESWAEIIELC